MRILTCTRCRLPVPVNEEPHEFFDPVRYVCATCLDPGEARQLALGAEPVAQVETRTYDPSQAAIPF